MRRRFGQYERQPSLTASYFYNRLRQIIYLELASDSEQYFEGEVEVDESYFGGTRKGKRGRGGSRKNTRIRPIEA